MNYFLLQDNSNKYISKNKNMKEDLNSYIAYTSITIIYIFFITVINFL